MNKGWIGVDLDGTLAEYQGWTGTATSVGKPIEPMVRRVKEWRKQGIPVKIMTARVSLTYEHDAIVKEIEAWCLEHIGEVLPITCVKDYAMIELWDDRAVRVRANNGEPCCDHHAVNPSYHKIT